MYILGISAFYHDSAACLLKDGEILCAAQEERFTRKKHDERLPINAVNFCLENASIDPSQIDLVAFYDKPFLKFDRILETYLSFPGKGLKSFIMSIPIWLKQKLWINDLIKRELNYEGKILFPEHHESHAASAFFPSPFRDAAFLTVDGVGEWATTSYGIGEENKVTILSEQHFPHSLGLLYSAFTYYIGFKVNSGEYKVMGLAPYGKPKYVDKILEHLVDLKEDGSFTLNMDYFEYPVGLRMTNNRFNKLFNAPPRQPESKLTQREMDLARSVQDVTEEIMIRMAKHVKKETNKKYLCLAGGVALNCVGNGKLLREGIFEDIWIQPAAGDAGGALGAAYIAYHHFNGNQCRKEVGINKQKGSYLGTSYKNDKIEMFLDDNRIPYKKHSEEELVELTSKLLADGNVIGWFQGKMEFGPRALGNRSIIGDARSDKMQKKMNLKIKYRESFRPFAPAVLKEEVHNWFEIDRESPYMLLVADINSDKKRLMDESEQKLWGIDQLNVVRSEIPAVTHVDYSARIQTVNRDDNQLFHKLINKFFEITGCPVVVNTSFNVRGEPIVESPLDAFKCFMRTEMDILVMGNFILYKSDQPDFHDDINWQEVYELD